MSQATSVAKLQALRVSGSLEASRILACWLPVQGFLIQRFPVPTLGVMHLSRGFLYLAHGALDAMAEVPLHSQFEFSSFFLWKDITGSFLQ